MTAVIFKSLVRSKEPFPQQSYSPNARCNLLTYTVLYRDKSLLQAKRKDENSLPSMAYTYYQHTKHMKNTSFALILSSYFQMLSIW